MISMSVQLPRRTFHSFTDVTEIYAPKDATAVLLTKTWPQEPQSSQRKWEMEENVEHILGGWLSPGFHQAAHFTSSQILGAMS